MYEEPSVKEEPLGDDLELRVKEAEQKAAADAVKAPILENISRLRKEANALAHQYGWGERGSLNRTMCEAYMFVEETLREVERGVASSTWPSLRKDFQIRVTNPFISPYVPGDIK